VAFSPDGKLLATARADGTVRLWNPATGQPIGSPFQTCQTGVTAVAFRPGDKLLASAGLDGTVRLWNLATSQPIGAPLHASARNGVSAVAFSSDGKLLAGAGLDGTVRLWDMTTLGQNVAKITDLVPHLCAMAGRPLTRAEWALIRAAGPGVPKGLPLNAAPTAAPACRSPARA
jgi:WD40 repeat protein